MVNARIAFFVLLLSVSVIGQEDVIVNENDRTLNVGDEAIAEVVSEPTSPRPEEEAIVDNEAPVELLPNTQPLEVRSGKFQLQDGLIGDGPVDLEAVNINNDGNGDIQSEKQLLTPSTTSVTNSEFGKLN